MVATLPRWRQLGGTLVNTCCFRTRAAVLHGLCTAGVTKKNPGKYLQGLGLCDGIHANEHACV